MKFADNVLLEIVNIVANALATGTDVSEELRAVDVVLDVTTHENGAKSAQRVKLSDTYLASKGRVF